MRLETVARPSHAVHVVQLVVDAAATLVGADRAAVLLAWQGQYVLVSAFGHLSFPIGLRSEDLPQTLMQTADPCMSQALERDGRRLGVLWVARHDGQPFPEETRRILEHLANVATLSLHPPASPGMQRVEPERPTTAVRDGQPSVPAFPPMLARIVSLADDDDTSPADLVAAVSADPMLVAHAMRVASAPALARARPPRSVKEAVMVLGLRGVRNLAIGQFTRSLFARWGTVDQLLWEHALGTAVGIHLVLEERDPSAAEDGYLCGLLHNLGMIVRHNADPEGYERVVARAVVGPSSWADVEAEAFGSRSLTLLPGLVAGWHLPPAVGRRLRELAHGQAAGAFGDAFAWAWPAALQASPAWNVALGSRAVPTWLVDAGDAARERVGLSPEKDREMVDVVAQRCATLRRLLG